MVPRRGTSIRDCVKSTAAATRDKPCNIDATPACDRGAEPRISDVTFRSPLRLWRRVPSRPREAWARALRVKNLVVLNRMFLSAFPGIPVRAGQIADATSSPAWTSSNPTDSGLLRYLITRDKSTFGEEVCQASASHCWCAIGRPVARTSSILVSVCFHSTIPNGSLSPFRNNSCR